MGWLLSTRILRVLAVSALAIGVLATWALAAGPGGWDHLGDRGTPTSHSLDAAASALTVTSDGLYVGGGFEDAGGIVNADRIAKWNGSSWSAVSSSNAQFPPSSLVADIAVAGGKVYAGGTFANAGGEPDADNLAVWDGASWEPFCTTPGHTIDGNVNALQIIGPTLYVGGDFHDGANTADYLLACDLATGLPSIATVDPDHPFNGPVKALTATNDGTLYAGGFFANLENIDAADNVAYRNDSGWHAMGAERGTCLCALDDFVRALASNGTDVFVGTDETNVAGIDQADHVVKWNGSQWSAMGSNTSGTDGWFSTLTTIYAVTSDGSNVFAAGLFQGANGDPRADSVAWFDGTKWQPVGSDGAGNGPINGTGLALAVVDRKLYLAGSFTSAGGDPQAWHVASFGLSQIIAYPTPTVTPGPSAQPTPTVTPGPAAVPTPTVTPAPSAAAPDVTPPRTLLRAARINQAARKATFRFASGERGSTFRCKLDRKKYKPCTSPKTYKRLKPGKHVFRVKARDRAGNVDRTPMVKRFKIKRSP